MRTRTKRAAQSRPDISYQLLIHTLVLEYITTRGEGMARSKLSTAEELVCGGVAGAVARGVFGPLDLIKIRYQLQPHIIGGGAGGGGGGASGQQYRSLSQTVRTIIAEEGFTGLYKGNLSGLLLVSSYSAVQFAAFHHFQTISHTFANSPDRLDRPDRPDRPSLIASLLGGAYASVVATTATYPFDLARTRLAAQQANKV